MDDLIVWPSKKVIDLITVEYDLVDQLPVGVTIVSVVVSSIVFQGFDDPLAGSMLYLAPAIHGSLIQQKVKDGIEGNVYNIRFDILLSDGQEWIKTFRLAITPNHTPAVPIFIPLYYTSRPYPIEFIEQLIGNGVLQSGSFFFQPFVLDTSISSSSLISGMLRNQLQTYNYSFESNNSNSALVSGTLTVILRPYNYGFESNAGTATLQSGALVVILVSYNYKEYMTSRGALISGTLV